MLTSVSGIHVEMELVKTRLDPITVSATQGLNSLITMIAWVSTQSFVATISRPHHILKNGIKPKSKSNVFIIKNKYVITD